jgi:rhamnulokinase
MRGRVEADVCGPLIEAGTIVAPLRLADGAGRNVDLVAPACHDTGSAVAAVRAAGDTAFPSSGTWSLLGTRVSLQSSPRAHMI